MVGSLSTAIVTILKPLSRIGPLHKTIRPAKRNTTRCFLAMTTASHYKQALFAGLNNLKKQLVILIHFMVITLPCVFSGIE